MSSHSITPEVRQNERIEIMDFLRGFAIFGILFMNLEWFNRPISAIMSYDYTQTGADHIVSWLTWLLVQGKFYKLFSLLFGMGFAVLLVKSNSNSAQFVWFFSRRMVLLFLFGVLHMVLFWGGDILHKYAMAGLMMLGVIMLLKVKWLSRYDTSKMVLTLALVLLLFPAFKTVYKGTGLSIKDGYEQIKQDWQQNAIVYQAYLDKKKSYEPSTNNEWPRKVSMVNKNLDIEKENKVEDEPESGIEIKAQALYDRFVARDAKVQREAKVASTGSFSDMTNFRIDFAKASIAGAYSMAFYTLLPLFLLGYWFVASGVMENLKRNKAIFKSLAIFAFPIGLIMNFFAVVVIHHPAVQGVSILRAAGFSVLGYGQTVLMLGYLGLFVLAYQTSFFSKLFKHFGPIGKMAFTNYIMQSVILTTLFYNYGFGLFGSVSRFEQVFVIVAIIIFQLVFSKVWLSNFKYGPLEWLWRCGTSGKYMPLWRV